MTKLDIVTDEGLAQLCQQLGQHPHIAIDTEFLRERTYYPALALVQIAYPGSEPILIDPLKVRQWAPFFEIMDNPRIVKILHAGRQDLEIFNLKMGKLPRSVFDTQIAAAMCGLGEQISYGALVQKTLGVQLQKSDGYTDWMQRPLTTKQVAYARDDVRYLIAAYEELCKRSQRLGRQAWLDEEMAESMDPSIYASDPDQAWSRVKKWSSLPDRDLVVLQALARWRELRARALDKPIRFVVSDEGMISVARMKHVTLEDLKARRSFTRLSLSSFADDLMAVHEKARKIPKDQWPVFHTKTRIPSEESDLVAELAWALLHLIARDSEISTSRLVTKKDLPSLVDQLVRGKDVSSHPLFHGWRYTMAGSKVEDLVHGRLSLTVLKGKVVQVT
ncbi:MAG: ribonuclease D [Acidobacteria bacterium]|nr:ribonuclease D [Acidobacteriota bacterium]